MSEPFSEPSRTFSCPWRPGWDTQRLWPACPARPMHTAFPSHAGPSPFLSPPATAATSFALHTVPDPLTPSRARHRPPSTTWISAASLPRTASTTCLSLHGTRRDTGRVNGLCPLIGPGGPVYRGMGSSWALMLPLSRGVHPHRQCSPETKRWQTQSDTFQRQQQLPTAACQQLTGKQRGRVPRLSSCNQEETFTGTLALGPSLLTRPCSVGSQSRWEHPQSLAGQGTWGSHRLGHTGALQTRTHGDIAGWGVAKWPYWDILPPPAWCCLGC